MRWRLAVVPALFLTACTSSAEKGSDVTVVTPSVPTAVTTPNTPASTSPSTVPSTVLSTAPPASALTDWPTYHGDLARSGRSTTMPTATAASVRASVKLDAAAYASPVVAGGKIIVATENNSVYFLDATGSQVQRVHLAEPVKGSDLPCGNIDPIGITGTPIVRDRRVYLVTESTSATGTVTHDLVTLELASGAVLARTNLDLPGADPRAMQQRGALTITNGMVWAPFGARAGDCGDYKGRVVGVPVGGKGTAVGYTTETRRGGGMWNPAGPTVLPNGRLLTVAANGAAFPGDAYDHTNSVLALEGTRLVDSFAPSDWAQNNQGDVGLGSQSPALVGDRWIVLGGKSGPVYVLRRDALGGIGGQVSVQDICRVFGGAAVDGDVAYLPCTDGVRAVRVGADGKLTVLWHAADDIAGSPVIGGGLVWALAQDKGVLYGLDPATGKAVHQAAVGGVTRFATPAVSGSLIVVGTQAGVVLVDTR